jgi:hypothetical protein
MLVELDEIISHLESESKLCSEMLDNAVKSG